MFQPTFLSVLVDEKHNHEEIRWSLQGLLVMLQNGHGSLNIAQDIFQEIYDRFVSIFSNAGTDDTSRRVVSVGVVQAPV